MAIVIINGDMKIEVPFIAAKNFSHTVMRAIDLIVIHTMEHPEKPKTAMGVARWFGGLLPGVPAPQASSHFCIDDKQVVQCVADGDVAWCAPGANHNGIHLEHAGYANQTDAQWHDAYSQSMLKLSALLAWDLSISYAIPVQFVDAEGLLEGDRGITTHREVTIAAREAKKRGLTGSPFFKAKTDHTDPGVTFPMREYLEAIKKLGEAS